MCDLICILMLFFVEMCGCVFKSCFCDSDENVYECVREEKLIFCIGVCESDRKEDVVFVCEWLYNEFIEERGVVL